ncbi:MAG: glycosyltransferase family 4 protein [Chthoniobacterales bacterium]|nr:glycosyltransferase family 4 protein [Chthoniobacterales bacterium]
MRSDRIGDDARRLTLFCQVFYPDEQSTAQLFSDWTAALVGRGWDVRVVCGYPPKPEGTPPPSRENWKGVEIRRVGLRCDFKRSLIHRATHYAAYLAGAVWELFQEPKRLALVVTNPPFLPIVASFVRKIRGGRYAVEIQDLYPDGLVAVGKLSEGLVARWWRWLNRMAFDGAEFTAVLGRDMRERLLSAYALEPGSVTVLPHWSPVEVAEPGVFEASELIHRHKLEKAFVVQYSGNMGLWHDIEQIVHAAKWLQGESGIHFLMIGAGMRRTAAESLAKKEGLQNMTWLPFLPKQELADSLSACHVALISQREGLEGIAVPCKLYGILASGRCVIGAVPENSETARVLREENCGVQVPPGDARALAEAIKSLSRNPDSVVRMGAGARSAYKRLYTLEAALDRFEDMAMSRPIRPTRKKLSP